MKTIGDASPLIYFSKIHSLGLLPQIFEPLGVPPAVYRETVMTGLARGFPDAERIKAAFQQGWLLQIELESQETDLAKQIQDEHFIGAGEAETIACCAHRGMAALIHDRKARNAAAHLGVQTWQPADALLLALIRRILSWDQFRQKHRELALVTSMPLPVLMEREALADEIAAQLGLKR